MARNAKAAALRFLKIRPRSIMELKGKLGGRGFSSLEIETTILDLMASGLLDDRAFTKSWINYRLARPFGFIRIIQELRAKGIEEDTIDQTICEAKGHFNAENAALELARRRWQRLSAFDPLKKKKRILDFLLRRGFEAELAMKVLKKL